MEQKLKSEDGQENSSEVTSQEMTLDEFMKESWVEDKTQEGEVIQIIGYPHPKKRE